MCITPKAKENCTPTGDFVSVVRNHGFPGCNFWRPVKEGSRSGSDTNLGSNFKGIYRKHKWQDRKLLRVLKSCRAVWKMEECWLYWPPSEWTPLSTDLGWEASFWKNAVDLSEKLVRWQRWRTMGRYQGPWHSYLSLSPTQKVQVTCWPGELPVLFASRGSHIAEEAIAPWKFPVLTPSISLEMIS